MKIFILSTGLCLLSLSVQAQQITKQITFPTNELKTSQLNGYDIVRLAGARYLVGEEHAGKPQLPVAHINILLPKGATVSNVAITGQSTQIPGNFDVYPAQPPTYPNFSEPPAFVPQDPVIYTSNSAFPQDHVLGFSTHVYREYTFVGIDFIPFSYQPQNGQLDLLNQVNITVTYTAAPGSPDNSPLTAADKTARRAVKNAVANPGQIEVFYSTTGNPNLSNGPTPFVGVFEPTDLPSALGSKVPYVIITNNTNLSGESVLDGNPGNGGFVQKFQEYADWKTQKGMPAKVVTIDAIRANYPGNDVAEQIRNFIRDAHDAYKWATEYVLLGGGASIVPARRIGTLSRQHSDLYYSAIGTIDSLGNYTNWNADGDGIYGEASDNADYTPDIAVGRAPVATEAEVVNFLKKNFNTICV